MQPACHLRRTSSERSSHAGNELAVLFQRIYEASGEPMLMLGPDGAVLCASDEQPLAAATADEATDLPLRGRLPLYLSVLHGEAPWQRQQQADITRSLPVGGYVHERIHLRPTAWGACLRVTDRSAERLLETADLQTARLAALGFMVAGVCHEVTNPLTSLHSIVQILRSEQPLAPELLRKGLDNIWINVNRILEISRRLVKFSRVGDEPRERVAIDAVVDEALHELHQQGALRDIEVRHTAHPSALVLGNAGQLRQIFLNLFMNAAQAMSGQGRLQIETRCSGGLTEVLVSDTGPGVPDVVASRIFEPFFTTRFETHGTGLGLSVSAEIAHEHHGSIELRHSSPSGATFAVILPAGTP